MGYKQLIAKFILVLEKKGLRLKRSRLSNSAFGRFLVDIVLWPSDFYKTMVPFRKSFGHYPNLISPTTFNEHLQRFKLFHRRQIYTSWADKILVREYVAEKIGREYLNPVFWIGTNLFDAKAHNLPNKFVIKANQGSGTNILVHDSENFDWVAAHQLTQQWLQTDHSVPYAEWQYRWIKPKLLIEEFIKDENGSFPLDYKFFCFHGRVHFLQVDFDRFSNHKKALLTRTFQQLPVSYNFPIYSGTVRRPKNFDLMIQLAEKLAPKSQPFVRVDLYSTNRIIFGELTLHPVAGIGKFDPPHWDLKLGKLM